MGSRPSAYKAPTLISFPLSDSTNEHASERLDFRTLRHAISLGELISASRVYCVICKDEVEMIGRWAKHIEHSYFLSNAGVRVCLYVCFPVLTLKAA